MQAIDNLINKIDTLDLNEPYTLFKKTFNLENVNPISIRSLNDSHLLMTTIVDSELYLIIVNKDKVILKYSTDNISSVKDVDLVAGINSAALLLKKEILHFKVDNDGKIINLIIPLKDNEIQENNKLVFCDETEILLAKPQDYTDSGAITVYSTEDKPSYDIVGNVNNPSYVQFGCIFTVIDNETIIVAQKNNIHGGWYTSVVLHTLKKESNFWYLFNTVEEV